MNIGETLYTYYSFLQAHQLKSMRCPKLLEPHQFFVKARIDALELGVLIRNETHLYRQALSHIVELVA